MLLKTSLRAGGSPTVEGSLGQRGSSFLGVQGANPWEQIGFEVVALAEIVSAESNVYGREVCLQYSLNLFRVTLSAVKFTTTCIRFFMGTLIE